MIAWYGHPGWWYGHPGWGGWGPGGVDLDRVDGPVLGRPAGGRGLPDPAAVGRRGHRRGRHRPGRDDAGRAVRPRRDRRGGVPAAPGGAPRAPGRGAGLVAGRPVFVMRIWWDDPG